jgi:hypothetical protein
MWTLFLLQNTFCHAWSRLVTLCHELLYNLGFDLYTVAMTLVDATLHILTVSHVTYALDTISVYDVKLGCVRLVYVMLSYVMLS